MKTIEESERRRRKRERVLVLILLTFVFLLTAVEVHLLRMSAELPFVNSIFFFGLMNLNIILIMLLLFLIFRNAVKLVLDERRGKFGSRLRTRLVLSFSLFAIIPTILLFCVSAFYIKSSFDKWFNMKIGGTMQKSIEVVQHYYENSKGDAKHFVKKISQTLNDSKGTPAEISKIIDKARKEYGLDAVEFHATPFSDRIISTENEKLGFIPSASLETLQRVFSVGGDCRIQDVGVGELVRCGVLLERDRGVVFADYFIPLSLASQFSEISLTYKDYKSDNPLNYPIKSSYFALLTMMTLLILFAATWTGFYMAKRLSIPIEELTKGTEEVQKGNLAYQIPSLGTDELVNLIGSFNHMTREIRQSKDQIEATNEYLKQVNLESERRRGYIEVLLESVQSGVISLDENGKISMVNHAASELLQIDAQKLIGRPYLTILPREKRAEVRETLRLLYKTTKPFRQEIRFRVGADRTLALMVTLSVLRDESQRQLGVVAVLDDVSDMQKMQRMIAWREVAKRIAHEIKNPLTPIQLSVQRLRRRYLKKILDDGTFDQATQIILNEVDSLKKMVSEFSAFARLPEITQLPESLNETVLEAVKFFKMAHDKIRFQLKLDESLPLMTIDKNQLKRVLINLFDNAVAALSVSEEQGIIWIETYFDRLNRVVVLSVADNGMGILPEIRSQLFEPYFSTKEYGTGLGLAIVQRIVSDHGGLVRVEDNIPMGARFIVELPDSLLVSRPSPEFKVHSAQLMELT